MKLYKQYLKEREDIDLIYTDDCFITYKVYEDNTAAIIDIYSSPEVRGKQVMKKLVEDIIAEFKEKDIKIVFGFTDERTNGWERSEQLMLKFGFKHYGKREDDEFINNYFKEI